MKNLSDLTPAQTLLLVEGKSIPIKDLLKVTMMDLLLRKVLRTIELPGSSTETSSISNTYIVAGNNFGTIKPLAHEWVFLDPYEKTKTAELLFSNLVKIGYRKAGTEKKYNKEVRDSVALAGCFETGFMSTFSPFQRSNYGQKVAAELKSQLDSLSASLPELMEKNPEKALEVLKHIKGNIFLVKGIDFKRMAEIENAVLAEAYSAQSVSNNTFADPVTWLALDFHSRGFDASCSGCSTGDGGGGCSVDSGCGGD